MPPQSQPTGELINTQPAPQQLPDPNGAVSLAMPQAPQQQPPQQPQRPQMTPERAKAALGVATMIQNHLLRPKASKQANNNGAQKPSSAPTEEKPIQPSSEPKNDETHARMAEMELSITKKLDDIRKELKGDHKKEIDALKKQIEDALNEQE